MNPLHTWFLRAARRCLPLLCLALFWAPGARGDSLLVAVASNFTATLEELGEEFTRRSGHTLRVTAGSTGVHYAQIRNGAPFDLFFSADAERARRVEEEGIGVTGTRFVYATGQLVLWSMDATLVDSEGQVLRRDGFARLAVANPDSAPYGMASYQTLDRLGLLPALQGRLVTGTNIGQTFQFVASGAASLGFVALSQLRAPEFRDQGSRWLVPASLHDPIHQEAILLRDSPAGRQFLDFVRSADGAAILRDWGYLVPAGGN